MSKEVERIAAGLSMGHRSVLKSVRPTSDGRVLVPSMLGNINKAVGWPKGIVEYYSAYYSRLTPLGLRVRNHLHKGADPKIDPSQKPQANRNPKDQAHTS